MVLSIDDRARPRFVPITCEKAGKWSGQSQVMAQPRVGAHIRPPAAVHVYVYPRFVTNVVILHYPDRTSVSFPRPCQRRNSHARTDTRPAEPPVSQVYYCTFFTPIEPAGPVPGHGEPGRSDWPRGRMWSYEKE